MHLWSGSVEVLWDAHQCRIHWQDSNQRDQAHLKVSKLQKKVFSRHSLSKQLQQNIHRNKNVHKARRHRRPRRLPNNNNSGIGSATRQLQSDCRHGVRYHWHSSVWHHPRSSRNRIGLQRQGRDQGESSRSKRRLSGKLWYHLWHHCAHCVAGSRHHLLCWLNRQDWNFVAAPCCNCQVQRPYQRFTWCWDDKLYCSRDWKPTNSLLRTGVLIRFLTLHSYIGATLQQHVLFPHPQPGSNERSTHASNMVALLDICMKASSDYYSYVFNYVLIQWNKLPRACETCFFELHEN